MRTITGLAPSGKGDYTLHKIHFFSDVPMKKAGSPGDGKFLYNNDCHKEEDFHINYHKKIVLYWSKPSETRKRN